MILCHKLVWLDSHVNFVRIPLAMYEVEDFAMTCLERKKVLQIPVFGENIYLQSKRQRL